MPFSFRSIQGYTSRVYDGDGCEIATAATPAAARQIIDALNQAGSFYQQAKDLRVENDTLRQENARLRAAVMNQAGDAVCHLEGTVVKLPPRADFLQSCAAFYDQQAADRGVTTGCQTITQLEAENASLRQELARLEHAFAESIDARTK